MTIASEYFESDPTPAHPRVARWERALEQPGARGYVQIHEQRGLLGREVTELYVTIDGPAGNLQDREPWSAEIHSALVELRVRGKEESDDVARFALALADAFEPIETDVGGGYFNAVLHMHLRASTIAADLAPLLDKIHSGQPSAGARLSETDSRIRGAIRDQGHDLIRVGWDSEPAARILVGAIQQYLDDRFHVTTRHRLGWG